MREPVLVITDGAPGLIAAVEQVFPASLRQRCLAHKMRNLEAKVPAERWREFGPMARAVYQASSPALARLAKDEFVKTWARELPSADGVLRGRLRGLHRAPAAADRAPPRHQNDQPSGAHVRRGAPSHEGDPACLRRKGGHEADVRRADARATGLAQRRSSHRSRSSRSKRCAIIYATNSSSDTRRRSRAHPAHEFTALMGLDRSKGRGRFP